MKHSIIDLIGNTPMLELKNTNIYLKVEGFNPTGSIKDRAAKQMILDAQNAGKLFPNSIIIEPTSGNTGIGLAAIGRALGYKVILTMPETMSLERRKILKYYGAEVVLTKGELGMEGAVLKARELAMTLPNTFMPSQFENESNPKAHYLTTGPEIWRDMEGKIDILITGVGTGGTLSGTGKYLKEKNPEIKVIAVEPMESPLLSKGSAGIHKIEGIGANFIPKILDRSLIDEVICVSSEDAISTAKKLAVESGIFAGISSGAALFAAKSLKSRKEYQNKRIVVILPDSADRYLSTDLFK